MCLDGYRRAHSELAATVYNSRRSPHTSRARHPSRKRAMFGLGIPELLILAFILLILFGNKLPGMMRSLGQGVVEFKKGVQGIEEDSDDRSAKSTTDRRG